MPGSKRGFGEMRKGVVFRGNSSDIRRRFYFSVGDNWGGIASQTFYYHYMGAARGAPTMEAFRFRSELVLIGSWSGSAQFLIDEIFTPARELPILKQDRR